MDLIIEHGSITDDAFVNPRDSGFDERDPEIVEWYVRAVGGIMDDVATIAWCGDIKPGDALREIRKILRGYGFAQEHE